MAAIRHDRPVPATTTSNGHHSVGELVKQGSEQLSHVVRSELKLAQAEMKQKGKRAGVGAGMLGGAGLMALFGLAALVTAAIAAVAIALPLWAAALVVFGFLMMLAGVLALLGKKKLQQATPAAPQQTIGSVKADVAAIKEGAHR